MEKATNLLMGINALEEVLRNRKEKVIKVFIEKGANSSRKKALISKLEDEGVPIAYCDKKQLEKKVFSDSHQSFVAQIDRSYLSLKEMIGKDPSFVLVLDQIYDPHNFGAILRACECFGVTSVIFSKNKGCPVTPVVTKVAAGASELVDLVRVSNIHDTILKLKDEGYSILASDCNKKAKSLASFETQTKSVLVIGSEEKGVSSLVKKQADHLLFIPMMGQIDSLNVSQATACFLFHLLNSL